MLNPLKLSIQRNIPFAFGSLLLLLVNLFAIPTTYAQVCSKNTTPQTISIANFSFSTTTNSIGQVVGIAIDNLTKLKWERCVYGQTWNVDAATCTGNPAKLTWREALSIGEFENKRLPDIKELNTILDLQCAIPPTNLEIFPNTPGSRFNGLWSSTPYLEGESQITNAWYINLGFGFANYRAVTTTNFVRYIIK